MKNLKPSAWGDVYLASATAFHQLPGIVTSIGGASKPEEWLIAIGIGQTYAVTQWRRTNIADKIEIEMRLPDHASLLAYEALIDTLRPNLGKRPPVWTIANRYINKSRITRVAVRDMLPAKYVPSTGGHVGVLQLLEYAPPVPVQPGPPDPPKTKSANDILADRIDDAKARIAKAQQND